MTESRHAQCMCVTYGSEGMVSQRHKPKELDQFVAVPTGKGVITRLIYFPRLHMSALVGLQWKDFHKKIITLCHYVCCLCIQVCSSLMPVIYCGSARGYNASLHQCHNSSSFQYLQKNPQMFFAIEVQTNGSTCSCASKNSSASDSFATILIPGCSFVVSVAVSSDCT